VSTASEALAAFAARLRFGDLPADVVAKAKRHVLDVIGVALASSTLPFAAMALRAAGSVGGHPGGGTVIGRSERLAPVWSAFVNGTFAHGIDFDDTHPGAVVHPSASVVPAALAGAEARDTDGHSLLAAIAVGLESAVRLGLAAGGSFHDRGFHPTGLCGALACSLVAGKLADLDAGRLAHALGLAASMAAGSLEFLTDGSWSKRIHAGWAAHGGIVAAELAAQGFSGPRQSLDGRFGFYRSHLGDGGWDLERVTRNLGERWEMMDIALKPYPCCHFNHAFIDCAAAARSAPLFDVERIERIDCHIHPRQMPVVCEPAQSKRAPQSEYDAKFSLPYAVGCMLARGHVDVDDFTDESIRDRRILSLAAKTTCEADPSVDYPRLFPGRLRITFTGGRTDEWSEPINRGSAERPLSDDEVKEKFRRNASRALSPGQVERLIDVVEKLEQPQGPKKLAAVCVPSAKPSPRAQAMT
jgi:2-methylcitrate dehydratase PrpD